MAFRNGGLTGKGDAVAIGALALALVLAALLSGYSDRVLRGWKASQTCQWTQTQGWSCGPVKWGDTNPQPRNTREPDAGAK